jgi:hypothetical protein
VEKDGEIFYDSRVANQETATNLYGEGAKYRPNRDKYVASDGSNIELLDGGLFTQNGVLQNNGDRATDVNEMQPPFVPGSVIPQMVNEMSKTEGNRHETLQTGVGPVSVVDNANTVNGVATGDLHSGVGLNLSYPFFGASYYNFRGHVTSGLFVNGQICVPECLSIQSNVLHPIDQTNIEPGIGTPQAGLGVSVVWKYPKEAFRRNSFDPITQQQLNRYYPGYPR